MVNRETILEANFPKLITIPNVLSIRADQNKIVNNVEGEEPCITFYVTHKLGEDVLLSYGITVIPKEINGVKTDVVELQADYELGVTAKGKLPPHLQKRLMGVIKE